MSKNAPLRDEGSRAELLAKLEERTTGWSHMGNSKVDAGLEGIERLKAGDSSVRVGQRDYVVTDE